MSVSLIKGITSVVGLGAIATAVGLGAHSLSSSQTSETPQLNLAARERWTSEGYKFLGFDSKYDSLWQKRFDEYRVETRKKFKEPVNSVEELKRRCKELLDSQKEDGSSMSLAWERCGQMAWEEV